MWIWDKYDAIPVSEITVDDVIEWVNDNLKEDMTKIKLKRKIKGD